MKKMGKIKTEDFVVEYELATKSEDIDNGQKEYRYRCHPSKIGEVTPAQLRFISAHDGELMRPGTMMKMFREA